MISPSFNLTEFVEAVKEKDYLEIISLAEKEVRMAEAGSSIVKGSKKNRENGSMIYATNLKGLLFLLKSGSKPMGAGIYAFRPIIENLVQRGQINPEIIELFK